MKLYTEEQVKDMLNCAMLEHHIVEFLNKYYTPIELPSDEEIYNASPFHDGTEYSIGEHHGFKKGAKWIRNKILNNG